MNWPFRKNEEKTPLDSLITNVEQEMDIEGVASEEFPKLIGYLERLTEVKAKVRRPPVSRDTIALIAGNLMGILLIVAYEQKHVMSSKGFSTVIRPK